MFGRASTGVSGIALATALLSHSGCGSTDDSFSPKFEPSPNVAFFDYTPTGESSFQHLPSDTDSAQDVLYDSPVGGKVTAYLVQPDSDTPLPAVIFLHPSGSGKSTQMDEAIRLTGEGFVALLIDSPKVRPAPWQIKEDHAAPNRNRDIYRQQVIDVRAGIDLLTKLDGVDASRISVVGKNLGGGFAGILSGVEPRVRNFVIQAAVPELGKFWPTFDHRVANSIRDVVGQERLEVHARETAVTDALNYVDLIDDKNVLYQWAAQDDWLTPEQANEMVEQTTGEVSSKWYDGGHGLPSAQVVNDYIDWLVEQHQ